ncbi:hypothetical protein EYF80_039977 [Liparis tanakae]|uniref:Uncharacterized protein n=1 Tax=Liparis tanakae TaxID=230148 RepID=A0A4Z2GA51_9TELE|nr:hypothetical protein EYF80_039977 [Liparis tanakae]
MYPSRRFIIFDSAVEFWLCETNWFQICWRSPKPRPPDGALPRGGAFRHIDVDGPSRYVSANARRVNEFNIPKRTVHRAFGGNLNAMKRDPTERRRYAQRNDNR